MNILITGIHGFVGSHLVGALSKEHVLYGVDIVAPFKTGVKRDFQLERTGLRLSASHVPGVGDSQEITTH